DNDIGYGLLRYLTTAGDAALADRPTPQLMFNYLGRFNAAADGEWAHAAEPTGLADSDPDQALSHAITLNAVTADGADGPSLIANWSWAGRLFGRDEIAALAQLWFAALQALVGHAEQPQAGGFTPSDLPLVTLRQPEIERIEAAHPPLADLLPLAPLQQGLLFHALYSQDRVDAYHIQMHVDLAGPLEAEALHRAGDALLRRHPHLRASFQHQNLDHPVQLIIRDLMLPWREVDLSALAPDRQAETLEALLAADPQQALDPRRPPLLRFLLIRLGPERHRLVSTNHHLILDGWSGPLLFQELFALYQNQALPAPTPYRDYLAWLAAGDRAASRQIWADYLAGLDGPSLVAPQAAAHGGGTPERFETLLSAERTDALNHQARRHGLTLNTVIQAAWAVLLAQLTGCQDVVFGITVAGRPPELPGIEQMIGLFINTLPLRLHVAPRATLLELMGGLQDGQSRLLGHQQLDLVELHRLAGHGVLFDTHVGFENYPIDAAIAEPAPGLRLTGSGHHGGD